MRIILVFLANFFLISCSSARRLKDRTNHPVYTYDQLEIVAKLDAPPGNIAVNSQDRVFVTLHPEANPEVKVVELVDGQAIPFPNKKFQVRSSKYHSFDTPLSLRVDQLNRLWILDYGKHGLRKAQLFAFDLKTKKLVHHHRFKRKIAPFGSMLNDFSITKDGKYIFIADTSIIKQKQAIIVYNTGNHHAKRVLHRHPSVLNGSYHVYVHGKRQDIFIVPHRYGVDSIALSGDDRWLFFKSLNGSKLYKVATNKLIDTPISNQDVIVEASVTISDGITTDIANNVYITDPEHSAILMWDYHKKTLVTLFKDKRIRWPDGIGFGNKGRFYFTESALDRVLFVGKKTIQKHAPFHVYRFTGQMSGIVGR